MGKVAYRKVYRIRPFGIGGYEITVPGIILDRAARSKNQTVGEFIKTHKVVHLFNDFTGFDAAYRFEPIKEADQEVLEISEEELEELAPPESIFDQLRNRLAQAKREI